MAEVGITVTASTAAAAAGLKSLEREGTSAFARIKTSASSLVTTMTSLRGAFAAYGGYRIASSFITTIGTLEQGWIGVAKTTGMAGAELDTFKDKIRDLSTAMAGLKIEELQSIATSAGQLGIKGVENLTEFTRVVGMMATATDLTHESAATGFARIANVMKEPISNLETLGSVINELSNTTTATAEDLVDFTQRVGGAAQNIGLTSTEVLALGATLKDMGVETEVAGTAVSQVLTKMLTDTAKFAAVAGVSVEAFTEKIKTRPIEAVQMLAAGMNRLGMFGAAQSLSELGLEGERVGGVLLKLSGGVDVFTKNLKTGNDELKVGTSLLNEYGVAAEGLFARSTSMTNSLKILGEQVGEALLPASRVAFPLLIEGAKAAGTAIEMLMTYSPGAILEGSANTTLAIRELYEAVRYGEQKARALAAGRKQKSAEQATGDLGNPATSGRDYLAEVNAKLLEAEQRLMDGITGINAAFGLLNIQSSGQFVEMADKAVAAFVRIKESGTATPGDILRAYQSASESIKEILDGLKPKEVKAPELGRQIDEIEAADKKGYQALREVREKHQAEWDAYWDSQKASQASSGDISAVEERLSKLKSAFEGISTNQTFSPTVKVEGVDTAIAKVGQLASALKAVADTPVVVHIKGEGSAVLPISEKIEDIKRMFGSLSDVSPDMTANFSAVSGGINDAVGAMTLLANLRKELAFEQGRQAAFQGGALMNWTLAGREQQTSETAARITGLNQSIAEITSLMGTNSSRGGRGSQMNLGGVNIVINGANDPAATARAVKAELQKQESRL